MSDESLEMLSWFANHPLLVTECRQVHSVYKILHPTLNNSKIEVELTLYRSIPKDGSEPLFCGVAVSEDGRHAETGFTNSPTKVLFELPWDVFDK